jgi:hypothetical protein
MTAVVYNTTIDQGADWFITYYYKQPATITNVSGNGTTVTFTAVNGFAGGQLVSITGVYPDVYNFTNATIASANANQFTVTNPSTGNYMSGGTAYAPVNLYRNTAKLQLRSNPDDLNAVLTLTTENGGITITALQGRIDVHATSTQTTSIIAGGYYYDIEITDPATSVVTRLAQGQAYVSAQVTQ